MPEALRLQSKPSSDLISALQPAFSYKPGQRGATDGGRVRARGEDEEVISDTKATKREEIEKSERGKSSMFEQT